MEGLAGVGKKKTKQEEVEGGIVVACLVAPTLSGSLFVVSLSFSSLFSPSLSRFSLVIDQSHLVLRAHLVEHREQGRGRGRGAGGRHRFFFLLFFYGKKRRAIDAKPMEAGVVLFFLAPLLCLFLSGAHVSAGVSAEGERARKKRETESGALTRA